MAHLKYIARDGCEGAENPNWFCYNTVKRALEILAEDPATAKLVVARPGFPNTQWSLVKDRKVVFQARSTHSYPTPWVVVPASSLPDHLPELLESLELDTVVAIGSDTYRRTEIEEG